MKTLTLWQPWATLMSLGVKTIETRPATASWAKNCHGALAIHAAKKWNPDILDCLEVAVKQPRCEGYCDWRLMVDAIVESGYKTLGELPAGAVVCVVNVVDVGTIRTGPEGLRVVFRDGTFKNIQDEDEKAFGDYRPGRLAIVTDNLRRLSTPVVARGQQGLWDLPPLAEKILARCCGAEGENSENRS
jgi:hypothetical protein